MLLLALIPAVVLVSVLVVAGLVWLDRRTAREEG